MSASENPAAPAKTRGLPRRGGKGPVKVTPEVPRSAFNFIAEVWEQRQAVRRLNTIAAGAGIFLVFAVFMAGLYWKSGNNDLETRRDVANTDRALSEARIRDLTGGVVNLPDHVKERRDAVDAALALDVDVQTVTAAVLATVPAGVEVHRVEVRTSAASSSDDESSGSRSRTTTTVADKERSRGPKSTALTVSISASEVAPGAARRWREALSHDPFFEGVDVSIGGGGRLTVDLAVADELTAQTRRMQARAELGGS